MDNVGSKGVNKHNRLSNQQKSESGPLPLLWGQPWHQTPEPRAVSHPATAEGSGHQTPEDQTDGV